MRKLRTLLVALCTLPTGFAQQSFSPPKIVFTGAPGFKPADLILLTGLTPGKPLTEPDIDKAMQQLVDTGIFADIRYNVDGRALTFALTPQPAANMVPAVYGNFVLWKPEELTSLVHAKVPLFTGMVPTSGNFQQTIADALTSVLADRGIKGHVEGILAQDKTVVYSITEPVVQIGLVKVDAVSATASPKLTEMLQSFASAEFDRHSAAAIQQRILDTYLDLGFLDIAVDDPVRAQPVIQPTAILVDFSTTAHEGGQYHVGKVDWPVNPVVPQFDFERDIQLKAGAPASRIEVLSAVERSKGEFTRRGYLDAAVTVRPVKNPDAHTVDYTFFAEPGEQYHLRSVHAVGFTEQQKIDFDKYWKLAPGAIYDVTYGVTFFQRYANLASLQGFTPKFDLNQDRTTHTADLVITLKKRSGLPAR
jgi:outer membrane protein assembly factor BamA